MQMMMNIRQAALAHLAVMIVVVLVVAAGPADAKSRVKHQKPDRPSPVEVDCTPRNGWGGYYGNPWCRTGPSEAVNRRQYGYPAWVSKKYREW